MNPPARTLKYEHRGSASMQRAIVEAALECFDEKGADMTIADVRKRASVSTGTLYHHFRDKEGLVAEIYRHLLRGYHGELTHRLGRFRTGRTFVTGIVRHFIDWVAANPRSARFLVEMRHAAPVRTFDEGVRHDTAALLAVAEAPIEEFVARGEIRRLPKSLYAPLILGPAMMAVGQWVREGVAGVGHANVLAEAAWRALRPNPKEKGART